MHIDLRTSFFILDTFRCQIDRLEEIKLEEMIDYHGGLLNEDFTKAIVNLYDHVSICLDSLHWHYIYGFSYLYRSFRRATISLHQLAFTTPSLSTT
jgi:hypothetical protein